MRCLSHGSKSKYASRTLRIFRKRGKLGSNLRCSKFRDSPKMRYHFFIIFWQTMRACQAHALFESRLQVRVRLTDAANLHKEGQAWIEHAMWQVQRFTKDEIPLLHHILADHAPVKHMRCLNHGSKSGYASRTPRIFMKKGRLGSNMRCPC